MPGIKESSTVAAASTERSEVPVVKLRPALVPVPLLGTKPELVIIPANVGGVCRNGPMITVHSSPAGAKTTPAPR